MTLFTISSVKHYVVRSPDLFANCCSAKKEKCNLLKLLDIILTKYVDWLPIGEYLGKSNLDF